MSSILKVVVALDHGHSRLSCRKWVWSISILSYYASFVHSLHGSFQSPNPTEAVGLLTTGLCSYNRKQGVGWLKVSPEGHMRDVWRSLLFLSLVLYSYTFLGEKFGVPIQVMNKVPSAIPSSGDIILATITSLHIR